jgi:menaquinone reductase, multiheme cytochrome c subunit
MTLIFSKKADKYIRIGVSAVLVAFAGAVTLSAYLFRPDRTETGYQPVQPVPYSHKLHAGNLGMDCRYCHSTVEVSNYAAVPATETCMNCHTRVKPESEQLQLVRESYATGRAIPWVRIHQLPDYVYFSHKAHVTAGVSCVSCHGRVDQMAEVKQVKPLTMAWCLECHRNPAASIRPRDEVTNLGWQPPGDAAQIGRELIAKYNIHPPTNCSGCHR